MFELEPPKDDDLVIPEIKRQSRQKHHFLMRYIDAFTTAMKGKWAGLHYIDLFAGAGIERLKDSQELDWGSPMIAAQAKHPFSKLHLCEMNGRKYQALRSRITAIRPDSQILHGDANKMIHNVIDEIPQGTLSLAFLGPFGLHLDYETLKALSKIHADLIIFFPDHLDALRNWEHNYLGNPDSNLDRCLGKGSDWQALISEAPNHKRAEILRELYEQQIRKLGYSEFDYERITMTQGHPLYCLIFCSRSKIATKIWRGISQKKSNGQMTFNFTDSD